jgi:hypothetical protein
LSSAIALQFFLLMILIVLMIFPSKPAGPEGSGAGAKAAVEKAPLLDLTRPRRRERRGRKAWVTDLRLGGPSARFASLGMTVRGFAILSTRNRSSMACHPEPH